MPIILLWTLRLGLLILSGITFNAEATIDLTCPATQDVSGCVDKVAEAGGGTVHLVATNYYLTKPLRLRNNVNIVGMGYQTIITWSDAIKKTIDAPVLYSDNVSNIKVENIKIVGTINQSPDSHDIRNNLIGFYLNCNGDPTSGEKTGCNNITLKNVEVENSSHGVHIKGASHVTAIDLKLHNNGNTLKDYFHNVYFRRVEDLRVIQTKKESGGFYDSPRGHGIRGSHLKNVYMSNLAVYDNADYGVHMDTVFDVRLHNLDVYDNCRSGKPGCAEIKCYGPQCDINYHAPEE